jgi:hypothetical protein
MLVQMKPRVVKGISSSLENGGCVSEGMLQSKTRIHHGVAHPDHDLFNACRLPTQLHSSLDRIQRMTNRRLDKTGTATSDQVLQGMLLRVLVFTSHGSKSSLYTTGVRLVLRSAQKKMKIPGNQEMEMMRFLCSSNWCQQER